MSEYWIKQIIFAVIISIFASGLTVFAQTKQASNKKSVKKVKPQKLDCIVYEPDLELLREMQGKIRIIEAPQDWTRFDRQRPITNADGLRSAYIAKYQLKTENSGESSEENLTDVIVFHNADNNKFYKISGVEDFPWRPQSELRWTSADVLEFEQWVNPDNGGRYAVNVKTGKVERAGFVRSNAR